jgi:hypothetical protein
MAPDAQTSAPPAAPPAEATGDVAPGAKAAAGYWHRLPPRFRMGGRKASRRTPQRPCLNCGDPAVGNYCPTCGQRKVNVRVSLREMVMEVVGDEMALSSALPRTLVGLLFRPGYLTREYVQGRCVRYILPLRLYLVTSIVFFLTLSIVTNPRSLGLWGDELMDDESAAAAAADDPATAADGTATDGERTATAADTRNFRINIINLGDTTRLPQWAKPVARRLAEQERRLEAMPPSEAIGLLLRGIEENAPKAMFVLLPVFAAVLKLLYIRRKRFYVEHFVFALHVHSMAYLLFLFLLVTPWQWLTPALLSWMSLYVFIAMKRVYEQGFIRTAIKYSLLGWIYSLLLGAAFLITAVVTALTI